MGMKQANRPLSHGWADSGDLELRCSLGRASTSLMRVFQSSMSLSLRGPAFWGPGAAGAGADMMVVVVVSVKESVGIAESRSSTPKKERRK